MTAYYNENDPRAAAWLRELIRRGLIADGEVDDRSIEDVTVEDLRPFRQCHFFAGIGGWSYALRLAGWPDDREVWTGSCPCQPFSAAGKRKGAADDRHLWPVWFRLISEHRPATVFGEQVAAAIGSGWLDAVLTDMEAEGYACAASVLPACSVGAPHARQRLWFVADAKYAQRGAQHQHRQNGCDRAHGGREETHSEPGACREVRELADADGGQPGNRHLQRGRDNGQSSQDKRFAWGSVCRSGSNGMADATESRRREGPARPVIQRGRNGLAGSGFGLLGHADQPRSQRWREHAGEYADQRASREAGESDGMGYLNSERLEGVESHGSAQRAVERGCIAGGVADAGRRGIQQRGRLGNALESEGRNHDPWNSCDWLLCLDGKARPVEPGTSPLAHGIPARVVRLRGYGNAIVPQVAAEFIAAFMEAGA